MINFDEFKKIELRVAKVMAAERVEGSEKLLKLQLNAGDKNEEGVAVLRQIVAGIGRVYEPEVLIGKEIVIVANLEPRELMGQVSNGMLLAAKDDSGPAVLMPEKEVLPGASVG